MSAIGQDESWCTIESDPGVFTELIEKIGVKDVQVEELYSLDPELMRDFQSVYGLIFLFKWSSEKDDRPTEIHYPNVFFAQQVVQNACATQAILSILLNRTDAIDVGPELKEFFEFTNDFTPDVKGLAISNQMAIREAHNSFKRPDSSLIIEHSPLLKDASDEVYHFISYVPIDGKIYELDGLKAGPILLESECTDKDWLDKVRPHIQKRMNRYASGEVHFNLMAILRNRKSTLLEKIAALEKQLSSVSDMDDDDNTSQGSSSTTTTTSNEHLKDQIAQLRQEVTHEEEKFKRWKMENIRRRHDYIPLVINLLRMLADKQQLQPIIARAIEKQSKS
mmetsp:Transcript_19352/g.28851  ORF Transcript_19352/g.28851 Transcript_19352/m.28851 type:complete len:336 (-) Transcript_19352:24-1031(-)